MIVTRDMHERKRLMFERSDAFVALPGGIGTLEELVEQLTWQQLGRHTKPILLANIDGFWEPLLGAARAYARDRVHPPDLTVEISESRTGRGYPAAAARRRSPALPDVAQGTGAGSRADGFHDAIRRHSADALDHRSETSPPRSDCRRDRRRTPRNIARGHAAAAPARRRNGRRRQRRRMERIDLVGRFRAKADMDAALRAAPAPCRRAD